MRFLTLLFAVLICARPVAAQTTYFHFTSQAGDYIGQGRTVTLTAPNASIDALQNFDNGVSLAVTTATAIWRLDFAATGAVRLTPGTYLNATRFPFNYPTGPGLDVSGESRGCNVLTGRFTILEAVYGAGSSVTRFAADFEQHCEGVSAAMFGSIRFNSSLPPPVSVAPSRVTVGPGTSTATLQVLAVPGLAWTASTSTPWISVPSTGSAGILLFSVARNSTTSSRTGTLVVGGTTVLVTQRANGVPGEPIDLAAATAGGTLYLAWQPPAIGGDATSYRLEAGPQPGTSAVSVDLPSAATSTAFPGAPTGRYFVRIIGTNEFGTGTASQELVLDMTGGTTPPARPRITRADVVNGVLYMTWDPPSPLGEITGYLLETGTVANAMNLGSYRLGPGTTFAYRMAVGGAYFLRLRAVNSAGPGPPSAEVMIRSGSYPAPPPAPLGLAATVTGSSVTLTWAAPVALPGEEALRYRVEAGPAPGITGVWTNVGGSVTTITFPGVPPGRYFVRVRGESARGRGAASNEISVIVP